MQIANRKLQIVKKLFRQALCALRFARSRQGAASLPVILLLGGILVEIAIAGAFLLTYLNNSIYGTRLANQALLAAQSGVNDAMLRIILNKNCAAASCPPYTLTAQGATAEISICKDLAECGGAGHHRITAIGHSLTKEHALVATLSVDPVTGLVTIDSILDQPQ